jgi:hypothetical protein
MKTTLKYLLLVLALLAPGPLWAESLFENAEATPTDSETPGNGNSQSSLNLNVNGYVKGAVYVGRNDAAEPVLQGSYGEFDIKGEVEKSELGRAFVEIRASAGENRASEVEFPLDIREAWAETHAGPLSVRLGRQIVVWGRADSINPTNNITPMNAMALSSEYDDMRMGNELLQLNAKLSQEVNLTGIWVPRYRPDMLPFSMVTLREGVSLGDTVYPDDKIASSSWAVRMEMTTGPIDGSISYYQGYETLPGFDYTPTLTGIVLIPTAYRMQAMGADFSTAVWDFGLRGEACIKVPELSYHDTLYVPASHFQYVVGLDRGLGDWNALVQYSGVYVRDFQALEQPVLNDPYNPLAIMQYQVETMAYEMEKLNRQFTGTTEQVSHAATAQIGWSGLAETLRVKLAGMYNFTTGDFALNPSAAYDIADAVTATVGARMVDGPEDSLNHLVNRLLTSGYAELKCSF